MPNLYPSVIGKNIWVKDEMYHHVHFIQWCDLVLGLLLIISPLYCCFNHPNLFVYACPVVYSLDISVLCTIAVD
jgi:hypothetical protein